ncbi:MAG: dihydrofolate reductase [Propionibacteriaceae bacterium]|jgi:dihydrofolate reductase|nr:dihydrofolate reductase [Propionibacteriaceae bacterium]
MKLTAIAAVGRNRVIGRDHGMPWSIPEDFRRFKRVTLGANLIMGRVTFYSIGKPLPGRTSIVISRGDPAEDFSGLPPAADGQATEVVWVHSLQQGLAVAAENGRPTFIGGGAHVYQEAWGLLTDLDITEVDASPAGDAFFPEIDPAGWQEVSREPRQGFAFVKYQRRPTAESQSGLGSAPNSG